MSEDKITIATVEAELPAVHQYAERHQWQMAWNPEALRLTFDGTHPGDGRPLRIVADVTGYRGLPPSWTFEDPANGKAKLFPRPKNLRGNTGSIFHRNQRRICAPFNRLAYKEHGGPHGNWGGPANWLQVKKNRQVRAIHLADMLAVIVGHLHASPGVM
ncbi:MAG: hypothetical protein WD294_12115 [Phycisphaeraceae bacterium]